MVKIFDSEYRSHWSASNPKREQQILRLLEKEDMGFNKLVDELNLQTGVLGKKKWSRQTLILYLKALEKKKWIRREKKGRRMFNSLVRNNPDVAKMLGWNRIPPDIRIRRRIELDKLDEEKFIAEWFTSLKFSFLNIIQDFMLLGKMDEEAETTKAVRISFLPAHIQDLVDIVVSYGETMTKRVKFGTLKSKRIWEVRNKLLEQIKNQLISIS